MNRLAAWLRSLFAVPGPAPPPGQPRPGEFVGLCLPAGGPCPYCGAALLPGEVHPCEVRRRIVAGFTPPPV